VPTELPPVPKVLHPNPVPLVHMSAFDDPEHDGIGSALGVVEVSAPSTVFAAWTGMSASVTPLHDGGRPAPPPSRNCEDEH